jgi:hypothetical protein
MANAKRVKVDSTVYERIRSVRMSEYERKAAINAMHDAEMIVDGFIWIARKIEFLGERLFLKPSLKH